MKNKEFINLEPVELVINIIGASASGKSTIQKLINDTLRNNGFKTEVNSLDDPSYPIMDEEARLRAIITKNKKIIINEVQAIRKLKNEKT
jgi:uridine kinase|tara:strand:+ start:1268 stop:1537 length:270 start_codon:yes stop_codon:yes gene_type:complete